MRDRSVTRVVLCQERNGVSIPESRHLAHPCIFVQDCTPSRFGRSPALALRLLNHADIPLCVEFSRFLWQ